MPKATTADIKVDAVRGFGGEVLLHGANFDEAKAKVIELARSSRVLPRCRRRSPNGDRRQARWRWSRFQQDSHLDRVCAGWRRRPGGGRSGTGSKQLMPQNQK